MMLLLSLEVIIVVDIAQVNREVIPFICSSIFNRSLVGFDSFL